MFKLASLIAIAAAAETAAEEKKKAEANLARENKKLGKALKTGTSKIGKLTEIMPFTTSDAPTYADLSDDCTSCIFSGSTWTAATTKDVAKCVIPATKLTALKKAKTTADPEGLGVAATVDADLTYKAMFAGIEECNGWKWDKKTNEAAYASLKLPKATKDVTVAAEAEILKSYGAVGTTFDAKKFEASKAATFKVHWGATETSSWGVARIDMPHDFAGGMYMSLINDDHTNVAVKVKGSITDRYFDGISAIATNIGKQDKFPLMTADYLEFFMQQKSTWTAALNKTKPFSITYTRASYTDIALFTAEHGGTVVWIIVGCVIVAACCLVGILWKLGHCCFGKKKDDADNFYAVEDCYARV